MANESQIESRAGLSGIRRSRGALLAMALLIVSVPATRLAVGALNRIPNTRAEFDKRGGVWRTSLIATALTYSATCVVAARSRSRLLRRSVAVGAALAAAAIFASITPIPFGVGALLGECLLYAAAAVHCGACLRAVVDPFRARAAERAPDWAAPLEWLCAALCVGGALLSAKLSALGWAAAMA